MSFSQNLLKTWSSRPATESPWWSAGFSSPLLSPSLSSSAGSCLGIQLSSTSHKLSFCCSQSSLHPGQERLPRNSLWQEAVASPLRPRSPPPQPRLKSAVTRQLVVKLSLGCPLNFLASLARQKLLLAFHCKARPRFPPTQTHVSRMPPILGQVQDQKPQLNDRLKQARANNNSTPQNLHPNRARVKRCYLLRKLTFL